MERGAHALITGGTGFVGSALVHRLAARGVRVTVLARSTATSYALAGVQTVRYDARTDRVADAVTSLRPDYVVHLAAFGLHPGEHDAATMRQVNIDFTVQLVEAAADWGLRRFVHVGSCFEYGPHDVPRLHERLALRPFSLYGATKAAGFLLGAATAHERGVPFVGVRLFGVYGPGEKPHRLLPQLIARLGAGAAVPLTPGEQQRDLMHVDDVAAALHAAAIAPGLEPGGVYNICSGEPVSVRQVAAAVAAALGAAESLLEWGAMPYRPGEPMRIVGDPARFRAATDWRPALDLRAGLDRMVHELRSSGGDSAARPQVSIPRKETA